MIRFEGNCTTAVLRQAKYRLKRRDGTFHIEVVIETPDGERLYPASREHRELVQLVNTVKREGSGDEGGQFYVNEYRQVIVPAGSPTEYYYAGEYTHDIVLTLDGEEFSGRPLDDDGNLLRPGNPWTGRPRPGIKYKLKAGGADIEYEREISPGRARVVRLSREIDEASARAVARRIAAIKGDPGGPFYVNEYRAIFGPVRRDEGMDYLFIGMLTEDDAWFPKWTPTAGSVHQPTAGRAAVEQGTPNQNTKRASVMVALLPTGPAEKTLEIADGERGFSYERLFADYLRQAMVVSVEDPYVVKLYQVANFLRFCELCVRLGSIRQIKLVSRAFPDDAYARLVSLQKSLKGFDIELQLKTDAALHDRRIETDTGWCIHLGRGLDIYKRPEDFLEVGVSDFELRPCNRTSIIYQKRRGANTVA